MTSQFYRRFRAAMRRALVGLIAIAGLAPVVFSSAAETYGTLPELHSAEAVRQLTPTEAARHYPVRLRGVLTFFDSQQYFRFVQDDTAGIYLFQADAENNPDLRAGELVEITGQSSPGEYAPVIVPDTIKILGEGKYPEAKPVSFEELASGQEDSQFVEIHGIVRAVRFDAASGFNLVTLAMGGGQFTAYVHELPVTNRDDLVDSVIRVRGVCATRFTHQRQLLDIRLLVPRPEDIAVEQPAPADPWAIPTQPLGSLLQFSAHGTFGHRVKVSGTVIYFRKEDDTLYVEDASEGLHIETRQDGNLLPGDKVEILGFPAKGDYTPMLQDAIFRKIGSGPIPVPREITADDALKGNYDCRLVRIEATLLDRARYSHEQFMILQADGLAFHASLERSQPGTDFAYLENGSKLAVSGVCLIEPGSDWSPGADWRAKSFRILMRTAGDVELLQRPPWWNLHKLLWAVGILGLVLLLAFGWVANLRLRVHKQTQIIRQKFEAEAALKERYEDLFENANDIVFTHDLSGRITSINRAGERLLQKPRELILDRHLVDLIAEEQRAAARQWLDQIVRGEDLPATEWDFVSANGQRHKLEINTRMVEQNGKTTEVEGIARDVTERKRLEREILEVSTREQRRIGHDLHDGICQQLACIAYLTDILADRLQENGQAESSEAEKIGGLLNEAITQTRSAARGLFPVRLEEDGLVSALEELTVNAGNLFDIECRLSVTEPIPQTDSGTSLHLYYIAQEAVLNAAKHGKAKHVAISLAPARDRFSLTVRDDGSGFLRPSGGSTGMGIRIMHYRARVIGGSLDLKSQPGQGTEITCVFYAKSPAPAGV